MAIITTMPTSDTALANSHTLDAQGATITQHIISGQVANQGFVTPAPIGVATSG